ALRSAKYFHACEVPCQHLAEIEPAILAWIVRVDSVDNDLGVIRIGAAHKNRRESARAARLDYVKSRNGFEDVRQSSPLIALDFFVRDDSYRTANLINRRLNLCCRNNDAFGFRQLVAIGGGRCYVLSMDGECCSDQNQKT